MVFFCPGISVQLFDIPGIFGYHNTLFLSSHHLCLIIGVICDVFVSCVDPLMGFETLMQTKCFEPLQSQMARVKFKLPVIFY